jgi:hypothetical protein
MIALDPQGDTLYAASASGITVLTFSEPLDQLPAAVRHRFRRSDNVEGKPKSLTSPTIEAKPNKLHN